jgi:hypothetical protein
MAARAVSIARIGDAASVDVDAELAADDAGRRVTGRSRADALPAP